MVLQKKHQLLTVIFHLYKYYAVITLCLITSTANFNILVSGNLKEQKHWIGKLIT